MGIGSKQSMQIKNQNDGEYTSHIPRVKGMKVRKNERINREVGGIRGTT